MTDEFGVPRDRAYASGAIRYENRAIVVRRREGGWMRVPHSNRPLAGERDKYIINDDQGYTVRNTRTALIHLVSPPPLSYIIPPHLTT